MATGGKFPEHRNLAGSAPLQRSELAAAEWSWCPYQQEEAYMPVILLIGVPVILVGGGLLYVFIK